MSDAPTVRHDDASQRYEVLLDERVVGYADHHVSSEGVEVFPHTVVDPAHRGQGLANALIEGAMADVRRRGVHVVPACSYVADWFARHPDEADLVAQHA